MTPDRLAQIEQLFHAVRERTTDDRVLLLAQVDPELRREVESLLARESDGLLLDWPAADARKTLVEDPDASTALIGTYLGPYRVEAKLGEGGMGEVFRAVDTRLGRAVAIKFTHERFSTRFDREARAISALNHPNICTLHDVGPNYLVMELVEGETLASRLKQGPLPAGVALAYGRQILAALAEAHSRGIIHRDLKPGNVMLTGHGVKVLDFGLAAIEGDPSITAEPLVMGTPAYMAPEQREGRPADARTDIYAFGCVLYEMLAGARVGAPRRRMPSRRLDKIVERCLEVDPGRRWPSAAALQRQLTAISSTRRGTRLAIAAAAAAAAAMLAVSAAVVYLNLHRATKLTGKDTIVLADFENETGDPVFDQTLRQGMAVQLEQSPFLTLVSDQQVQQVLRLMNRPPETRLTPQVAREVCERTGSTAVLEGSIASLGSQYVLWLRARNCRTGEVLAEEQAPAERKEKVLNTLTQVAIQMRTTLGESLATINEHSTHLEAATTPSLDALKAYSAGRAAMFAHGVAAGLPHLQRAVAIDPQFAMAYADLSISYWTMGETDLAAEYTRKAYDLRERVSDRERLWILFLYDRQVTGNLQRVLQTLESWVQTYPRDFMPRSVLAGWGTLGTGQYERGIEGARAAIQLNPGDAFAYDGLALHNLLLDRFAEATQALQHAAEHNLKLQEYTILRYYLAFFHGDQVGMEREVAGARGQHGLEDWMSHNEALVRARSGRLRQARMLWQRAIDFAKQTGDDERAAIYEAAEAVSEAQFGNGDEATREAEAALRLARNRDVEYAAAFALALAGDLPSAQRVFDDLRQRFPEDTCVQFEYLPVLRAQFALARGAPLDAVEHLQTALPYDFALPGTAFFAKFGALYPAYVRGEAYLAARRGHEAEMEFEKIFSHRGLVFADPIGALAHLQLGRAFMASGDRGKAKDAYRDFVTLWKDADPDIPILALARAEYATLQ